MTPSIRYVFLALATSFLFLLLPGGASGASLCSLNQTPCSFGIAYSVGTKAEMALAASTKLVRASPFTTAECTSSTGAGQLETAGGESKSVEVPLSSFAVGGCEFGCPISVLKPGRLSVQSIEGVMNGPVRWSGFELKETCGGFTCILGPEVSKGILLKGGTQGILKFEEAAVPYQSGGAFCTGSQKWTGQYKLSKPAPLYVAGTTSESLSGEGVFCGENTTPCPQIPFTGIYGNGATMSAKLRSGTTSVLNAGFPVIKCEEAGIAAEIENPGGAGEPVVAKVTSLSFGACNCKVSVLKNGRLVGSWTSGSNGALSLNGFEIFSDCGGKECSFAGNVSEGVTLEGSSSALIKAKEAPVPKKSGVEECKNPKWTAEFELTLPKNLFVTKT